MSNKKPDIAQIRKYLNGELDATAMHRLERQAEADPFLWDIIKGMEMGGAGDQPILDEIDMLIDQRVEKSRKRTIPLWTIASIAASLLIALGIGGWLFIHQTKGPEIALNTVKKISPAEKRKVESSVAATKPVVPVTQQPVLAKLKPIRPAQTQSRPVAAKPSPALAVVTYKTDTVEYKASDYKVRQNATVDELLKKMDGFEVGADGSITHQGQAVTKVKVNGKAYNGGDINTATKNLPADVIDKIQVIDDYGNQAALTGLKDGSPNKVLNIDTRANGLIAGTVVDKNNSPMANAIITQNGTQNTVHTDANGYFKIAAPVKSELIVNSMGYVPKLVKVNDNNKLKITLSDSLKTLAEVQIRGSATLKKTEATGAVSTIQAKDLEELQATTIDQALQGRLPGVAIVSAGKDPKATKTITGRVIAKDDHQPLPGVSIMVKGSSTGTVTDINGKFKLTLPPKADALVLAYIGYERKEVKVPSKNDADIELASSSRSLSEVVVTRSPGYSQDQEENTEARPYAGWDDFNKYIKDNATAIDGKKGVVRLAFTVNPDGSLSDITVKKGISPAVDQKAINLLKNGPQWRGNKNGKPETVRLRVRFK